MEKGKKAIFKNPEHAIIIGGRTITPATLTADVYDELIAISENHKALFDIIDEESLQSTKAAVRKGTEV